MEHYLDDIHGYDSLGSLLKTSRGWSIFFGIVCLFFLAGFFALIVGAFTLHIGKDYFRWFLLFVALLQAGCCLYHYFPKFKYYFYLYRKVKLALRTEGRDTLLINSKIVILSKNEYKYCR